MGGTESLSLPITSIFPADAPPQILQSKSRYFVKFLVGASNRCGVPNVFDEGLPSFRDLPLISLLTGYFQDFRIVDQIPIDSLNQGILGNLTDSSIPKITDCVCIHIRRRDYPQSVTRNFGIEYYVKAIQSFQDLGFNRFDCYSDDISAAQQVLSFLPQNQKLFPETSLRLDSISLLRKMSTYQNFVLSQSSLAWWASYLSFRNNKDVRIEAQLPPTLNFINSKPV
jgi:hypothetical protein